MIVVCGGLTLRMFPHKRRDRAGVSPASPSAEMVFRRLVRPPFVAAVCGLQLRSRNAGGNYRPFDKPHSAMTELERHVSPVQNPQGLAWDGNVMWVTSAANGRLYAIEPQTWRVQREFVPPSEALGITYAGSDFRLVLAPDIGEQDLERDHRYVYRFSPDAGFSQCFVCPHHSGSFLAYAGGALFVSQAWDKKIIEVDDSGGARREVQLERRPVGMTIVNGAFYLVTVDDEWVDGRFDRLALNGDPSSLEALRALPFKPRSVAFDGERFWTADRNNDGLVSFPFPAFAL